MRILLPAILCCAVTSLTAQPDPLRDCRRQASVSTGAALSDVDARVYESLILWTANTGNRVVSGYCEADQDGRIARFEQSPRAFRGKDPVALSPETIDACRREVSIATGVEGAAVEVRVSFDLILWQARAGDRRTGGFCQADSRGRIVRFEADRSEIEDLLSHQDAEATCARAARWKLGADYDEVAAAFERSDGDSKYRIQWRYADKTGWCVIDASTGRLRRLEASGGW